MEKRAERADQAGAAERAADTLFRTFAEMISNGTLKEGDPLPPEREIVGTYGVSRTVAREAVQALANRGFVEARPRFRPIVRRPSYDAAMEAVGSVMMRLLDEPDGVRALFETRVLVETSLARQAASHATEDEVATMKEALDANEAAIHDSTAFYETDQAFHATLFAISRNPVMVSVHKAYSTWLAPQWSKMPRLPDRNQRNYKAHKAILNAISKRDADAAEAAMRAHLDAAWDQVKATFRNEQIE